MTDAEPRMAELAAGADDPLAAFVDAYVSAEHRDDPATGCGVAALGTDVPRIGGAAQDAYRAQVETDSATPVKVATTTRQPTVSKDAVDQKMASFATPAMSANITVRTDAAHTISFSPQNSIWKFLSVQPVDEGDALRHAGPVPHRTGAGVDRAPISKETA